ncbi:hypothetical protein DSO57_1005026 [Entomophthora muscae]|uniref:Uncharacterized protein n=1 Tax=Entomophthora muscae TaxID=34485 RepID=A0ACC2TJN3_9FUNG|nr:hypothetical protein DSO57_1005026 [Entomophthora muscae]
MVLQAKATRALVWVPVGSVFWGSLGVSFSAAWTPAMMVGHRASRWPRAEHSAQMGRVCSGNTMNSPLTWNGKNSAILIWFYHSHHLCCDQVPHVGVSKQLKLHDFPILGQPFLKLRFQILSRHVQRQGLKGHEECGILVESGTGGGQDCLGLLHLGISNLKGEDLFDYLICIFLVEEAKIKEVLKRALIRIDNSPPLETQAQEQESNPDPGSPRAAGPMDRRTAFFWDQAPAS